MSDPTSIFENTNSGNTTQPIDATGNSITAPNDSELTNLLNGIKNERGEPKYKSVKEAIIGLQNAQEFIPSLKTSLADKDAEISRLRLEANRVAALEDAVRNLTEQTRTEGSPTNSGMSEQDIANLVNRSLENTLTQREVQSKQKENIGTVVSALQTAFGQDAEKKFYEKATELGMSVAEFNALAAKSPKMVLNSLGVTGKEAPQGFTPTQGSVNTQGFTPTQDTSIGRNKVPTLIGATTQDLMVERLAANKMVSELHAAGKSVYDLTDPKVYFKHFGR